MSKKIINDFEYGDLRNPDLIKILGDARNLSKKLEDIENLPKSLEYLGKYSIDDLLYTQKHFNDSINDSVRSILKTFKPKNNKSNRIKKIKRILKK